MHFKLLGFSSFSLALGLCCLFFGVFVNLEEMASLFTRPILMILFFVSGVYFIISSLWGLGVLKRVEGNVQSNHEAIAEVDQLKSVMQQNRENYESQLEDLKKEVSSKSLDVSWFFGNSPIGIFSFNHSGQISDLYSPLCISFFGENFHEKKVEEILYSDVEEQSYFKEWASLLPNNVLPYSDLVGLLTTDSTVEDPFNKRKRPKHYHLRYYFYPSGTTDARTKFPVQKVYVFVVDVSRENTALTELSEKESRLEFLLSVLRDKKRYEKYLELCRQSISELEVMVDRLLEGTPLENVQAAFRLVHTVRGNSAAFGVRSMRDLGDVLEKVLIAGRDGEVPIDHAFKNKLVSLLPELTIGLDQHIEESERLFNEIFDPNKTLDKTYQVSVGFLQEYETALKQIVDKELSHILTRKLKEISFTPIKKFLLQYSETIQQLAIRQEKKIAPLVISGGDTLVEESSVENFFASFIHLVLNGIDHGVEKPAIRLELGKAEEAIIRIRAQAADNGLYLSIEDDGRGIDLEDVTQKAVQKGLLNKLQADALSDDQKYELIFKDGFSTSRRVTSVSGRGMGMSAVKHEIDKLKGSIKVKSIKNKGTIFTIFLPVEAF